MSSLQPSDPPQAQPKLERGSVGDVLDDLGDAATVVATGQVWDGLSVRDRPDDVLRVTSLETMAMEQVVGVVAASKRSGPVVGIGGGTAIDAAKAVADSLKRTLIIIPASTATLAPFVSEVAHRHRREVRLRAARPAHRIVLDIDLLQRTPPAINRLGSAELVASLVATNDWRETPSALNPFDEAVAEHAHDLVTRMASLEQVDQSVISLASLLAEAGALIDHVGHRRMFEGPEHLFVEAAEHRLGPIANRHGELVALGTVIMAELQECQMDRCEALLAQCGVAAHPTTLGLDEDVFNGLLRHTVRFALGEDRTESILNRRQIDRPTAAAMWRRAWNLPR